MLPVFSTTQYVQDFLKAMMVDAGLDTLPANVQDQMLSDLYARLEDWMFGHVLSVLNDEQLTEYRELLESKASQEKLEEFLNKHVPNAADVFAAAMLDFRKSYLGLEN